MSDAATLAQPSPALPLGPTALPSPEMMARPAAPAPSPLLRWVPLGLLGGLLLAAGIRLSLQYSQVLSKTRLGLRRSLMLTTHESAILDCVVDPAALTVTFDDIGALQETKRYLRESVVWPFNHPELFGDAAVSATLGVLLFGPPGTGKTMLAKAIAKETHAHFLEVKVESLFSKWVGESEKLVSSVFTLARKLQPAIIFIDEVEALLGQRGGSGDGHVTYNHAKTIFLRHWDGITSNAADAKVMVIGCTNRPGDLDDAILRRMPTKIKLSYPSHAERLDILQVVLRDWEADLTPAELDAIAKNTSMFSGSDLKELCKEARMCGIRELVRERASAGLSLGPAGPGANGSASSGGPAAGYLDIAKTWVWGPTDSETDAPERRPTVKARPVAYRDFMAALKTVHSNERFIAEQRYGLQ
eukprot:EG_transcript_9456